MTRLRFGVERGLLFTLGLLLTAVLVLPLVSLVVRTPPEVFFAGLSHPLVWPALRLSATSTAATLFVVVLLGTPLAWCLSQVNNGFSRALETLLLLPMVIPPAVSGITLLLAFGRRGLLTQALGVEGSVAFTPLAVVVAQVFVSAPYYLQASVTVFRRLDHDVLLVARTLGATPLRLFLRIAVPLGATGLLSAAAVCWARALGEFGATLMFAGNLEGVTQTLPLAIYTATEADIRVAQALSLVLVLVALAVLVSMRSSLGEGALRGRWAAGPESTRNGGRARRSGGGG